APRGSAAPVPLLVQRPLFASQALCLEPLMAARGAHTSGLERVPHVQTPAHPSIASPRFPSALRTSDTWPIRLCVVLVTRHYGGRVRPITVRFRIQRRRPHTAACYWASGRLR